jgi:hypothetical protein
VVQVGDSSLSSLGKTGKAAELTVGGTYKDNQIAGNFLIGLDTYDANFTEQVDQVVAMTVAGCRPRIRAKGITSAIGASNVVVRDQSEFKAEQRADQHAARPRLCPSLWPSSSPRWVNVNTLALSAVERTARWAAFVPSGHGRRQVRRMVRLEAVASRSGTWHAWKVAWRCLVSALRTTRHRSAGVIPFAQLIVSPRDRLVIGVLAGHRPAGHPANVPRRSLPSSRIAPKAIASWRAHNLLPASPQHRWQRCRCSPPANRERIAGTTNRSTNTNWKTMTAGCARSSTSAESAAGVDHLRWSGPAAALAAAGAFDERRIELP